MGFHRVIERHVYTMTEESIRNSHSDFSNIQEKALSIQRYLNRSVQDGEYDSASVKVNNDNSISVTVVEHKEVLHDREYYEIDPYNFLSHRLGFDEADVKIYNNDTGELLEEL